MSSFTRSHSRRALAGGALLIAATAAACTKSAESKPADSAAAAHAAPLALGPQDVATAQLAGGAGGAVTLSGPLNPKEIVTLRAQVGGTVADLRVDRGSAVRRGQVLARIRAAGVESQAAGARAGVAAAEAALAVARQRLDAANTLRQAGAMSDIDLKSAQAAFQSAQAQVAAAHAQATSASEAAGFTTVVAPIGGVVSVRKVQEGEAVNPGGELLTLVNGTTLELAGQIAVGDAARVRVGQGVEFQLDAYPGEAFKGRVARIDPVADAGTRQVGVYVELSNSTGRIIGGTFARGRVIGTASAAAPRVTIPATAVQGAGVDGQGGSVLVIERGRIVRRAVTLGARDDANGAVEVLTGLAAGEQVIAVPTAEVKEGAAVTLASAAAGTTPAATKE